MALGPGDRVPPDLRVVTPAGEETALGELLRGTETLVIFLRHLG